MMRLGVLGRNAPGKGIEIVNDVLNMNPNLDVLFIVFSDQFQLRSNVCPEKVSYQGWQDRNVVWSETFDALLLPMTAPETYSYVMHEAIHRELPLFVNNDNASLTTQLKFANYYNSLEELVTLLESYSANNERLAPARIKKTRNLWNRIK